MKIDVLLFTQTMSSLLSSSLSLQDALRICYGLFSRKNEKKFIKGVLKEVNEGKRLSDALGEHKKLFPSLYIPLVSIGEKSGTTGDVFAHLSVYLKERKNIHKKITQALLYPAIVLVTALVVIFILAFFVLPGLEEVFEAFTESSENIVVQAEGIKKHFFAFGIVVLLLIISAAVLMMLRRFCAKAAYTADCILLKVPFVKNFLLVLQMHDFSFAMKLLSENCFPLVESLALAGGVLSNRRIKKAVESVTADISDGGGVGDSFEKEKLFPEYFTVWVKTAEQNGKTGEAFAELCNYYSRESENMLTGIAQSAEPVFILVTGLIIAGIIVRFVIPVFNLLGDL